MRRLMVVMLITGLFAGASIAPAEAAKKKRKKPVTFEATGTLAFGNPLDLAAEAGITRNEFTNSCAVPTSQGVDGYVIELPAAVSAVSSNVVLSGSDASGVHDLDMYFFDESCGSLGEISTAEPNEFGVMSSGVRYVLVTAFLGAEIEFRFNATEV